MALLLAAAQAVEAEDSENDSLMIQEDNENEDGVTYHKKEELKLRDELTDMKSEIDNKGSMLSQVFSDLSSLLATYNSKLSTREDLLHIRECEKRWSQEGVTENLKAELLEKEKLLSKYEHDLEQTKSLLSKTQRDLVSKISVVTQKEGELTSLQNDLRSLHSDLVRTQGQFSLKETLHDKLQFQMQEERAKFKKEIAKLKTTKTMYLQKTGVSHEDAMEATDTITTDSSKQTTAVFLEQSLSDEVHQDDQTFRIKQEPVDPDDQILIQNNQTQQVTVLNKAPVMSNIQKVVPVSLKTGAGNPPTSSSMVTVYVQSTAVPAVHVQAKKTTKVTTASIAPDPNQKFVCSRCGKRFIEWLQLQKHLETHSGSRPYKCKFCDKTFRQKYVLDTHIRTHTGERPYKCEQCYQSFGQKATLMNHVRTHTGEKPYPCESCDKSFAQLSSLSAHARMHGKEDTKDETGLVTMFTCDLCGSMSADKTGYLRHLRTVHKINTIEELKPVHLISVAGSPSQLSDDNDETD